MVHIVGVTAENNAQALKYLHDTSFSCLTSLLETLILQNIETASLRLTAMIANMCNVKT